MDDMDKQAKTVRVLRNVLPAIGISIRHLFILFSSSSAFFKALVLLFPPSQFLRRTEKIGLKEEIHKG